MTTTRLTLLRDRLEDGPATTTQLAAAVGCDPSQVAQYVARLQRAGFGILNTVPPGSRVGAVYVLLRRPRPGVDPRWCLSCGTRIASDHAEDSLCSACQRTARDGELGMVWAEALPGVEA